jgi:hypothetical protein
MAARPSCFTSGESNRPPAIPLIPSILLVKCVLPLVSAGMWRSEGPNAAIFGLLHLETYCTLQWVVGYNRFT